MRSRSPLPKEGCKVAHKDAAHVPPESREPSAAAPEQPPLSPKRRQLRARSPAHADSLGASPQRSRPPPELWRVTDWVLAGVEAMTRLSHGVIRPRTLQSLAKLPQLYQLGSLTYLYAYQLKYPDLDDALQVTCQPNAQQTAYGATHGRHIVNARAMQEKHKNESWSGVLDYTAG